MKISFLALTIAAAGILILAASCQQSNKGDGAAGWHLKPPGSAAGYGRPPLETGNPKEPSSATPGDVKSQEDSTPAINETAPGQPTSGGYGTGPFAPAWKIEPPPSAAGYGK